MKKFTAVILSLVAVSWSGVQAQNRPGSFATIPVPGQVPAPQGAAPQLTTPPGAAAPRAVGQGQPPQQQQLEQLRIVADPATNSLIVYGTVQEYQNIKNILKELDAVPRQVLIEALILQIDLKDTEDFGIDYEILKGSQTVFGKTFGSRAALTSLGQKLFPSPPAFAAVSGLSAIAGDNTVSAMIRAAATDSRIKIISSPSVIASDNRPARIQVGSEEPVATGTIAQAVGGVAQTTSIQYRNTGRILTIIPQVNSQGLVNLQIKAEVSSRGQPVTVGQDQFPAFDTQDAETTAVVHDGETLVIGGLIGERKTKARSGIPYLMDIPVIGRFFGTTNDESSRTELIMLITPRVIRNRDESRIVTADFKAGLEKVKAELDRVARDRARLMPPQPNPQQSFKDDAQPMKPAPAVPQMGPRTALPPTIGNVTVLSNDPLTQRMMPPMAVPQEAHPVTIAPPQYAAAPSQAQAEKIAGIQAPVQPSYALSFTPVVPVAAPIPALPAKPTQPQKSADGKRIWTVQVAAVAENSAGAESLAQMLRQMGYQAYVRVAQLDNKVWHRVRVGQLTSPDEAAELRSLLSAKKEYKGAFIARY